MSRPGARGVLFRIFLFSHGYTLAAKGTPYWFSNHLDHEAKVYHHLECLQGKHIPVHVGNIALETGYYFEGIAIITHMMLLSFAGLPISRIEDCRHLQREVTQSIDALHQLGVLHCDIAARNILYGDGQVMVIEFDRARILESRTILGDISNRKRERGLDNFKGQNKYYRDRFSLEVCQAIAIFGRVL